MAVNEVKLPEYWNRGLDFGGFFYLRDLVEGALVELVGSLKSSIGYCLRFHEVQGGLSWFEPYDGDGVITGTTPPAPITIPSQIPFDRILVNTWGWPVLATTSKGPPSLPSSPWVGQVRLNDGAKHVGYFKVVSTDGVIDERLFALAYYNAKSWLDSAVTRQIRREEFADTLTAIRVVLNDGKHPRLAVCQLATLLTSHLGAGVNRAALFVPLGGVLECIYAHGGDGSDDWAGLQHYISARTRTVSELHDHFGHQLPVDDPFYDDMVGEKVGTSHSLIARIWKDWRLNHLADAEAVRLQPNLKLGSVSDLEPVRTIAGRLDCHDAWIRDHSSRKPESSLLKSRCGHWYAFPWMVEKRGVEGTPEQRCLGVWLVDLANWAREDITAELIPRLVKVESIIGSFANHFEKIYR